MADLKLSGTLNFTGLLELAADGGKVFAGEPEQEKEVLLEGKAKGSGSPVLLPPNAPKDPEKNARITKSFNSTVTVSGINVVTTGIYLLGGQETWPGMVLKSSGNPRVTVNDIPMNVKDDAGITLPNGATATFDITGQNTT